MPISISSPSPAPLGDVGDPSKINKSGPMRKAASKARKAMGKVKDKLTSLASKIFKKKDTGRSKFFVPLDKPSPNGGLSAALAKEAVTKRAGLKKTSSNSSSPPPVSPKPKRALMPPGSPKPKRALMPPKPRPSSAPPAPPPSRR